MKIGDKIHVLLPWYTQCTDDTSPYFDAVIVDARDDDGVKPAAVKVEYVTLYGRRDLWIDMDNLSYTQDM